MWLRFLLRLVLIPVVAGISYEFIRLAGRTDNVVMNILSKPGMWIQQLTTKNPDEEMIQVAIISVEAVLYGKEYVDAVNDAQGIGKSKTTELENIEEEEENLDDDWDTSMLEDDDDLDDELDMSLLEDEDGLDDELDANLR